MSPSCHQYGPEALHRAENNLRLDALGFGRATSFVLILQSISGAARWRGDLLGLQMLG